MRALRLDEMARDPKTLRIEVALKAFRIHYHDLNPTTLDGYRIFIRKYATWLKSQKRKPVVAEVELGLVDSWIEGIRIATSPQTGKPYSGSSQVQAWAALRKFAVFAAEEYKHRDQETGGSVLLRLKMPVIGDDGRRELSDAELWRVLDAARYGRMGARNYAIVFSDANLGLRRGELIGFKIRQIDWEQRTVFVRRTTTKGKTYERKITMGPEVMKVLHHWIFEERDADADDEDGEVFLLDDGRPLTSSALNRMAREIKARSGVKRYSLHLGRHTWATNFRRAGTGDLLDLQRQGGWRDQRSVERYVHDRPDEERRRAPSPMSVVKRPREQGQSPRPKRQAA
jgi:integrase